MAIRLKHLFLSKLNHQLLEVGYVRHQLMCSCLVSNKLDAGELEAQDRAQVGGELGEPLFLEGVVFLFFLGEVLIQLVDKGHEMLSNLTDVRLRLSKLV